MDEYKKLVEACWWEGLAMPEWPSDFPYFKLSEFCNKEFMIWATVSSRFCFYSLYTAFPPSAAKNINLISLWPSGDVYV